MVSREEVDEYMKEFVDSMEAPEDKDEVLAYMKEFVDSMEAREKAKEYLNKFAEELHESPDKADEYMKKFVEEIQVSGDQIKDYTKQLLAMSDEEYQAFSDKYPAEFKAQYKFKMEEYLRGVINDTKSPAELEGERLRGVINDTKTSAELEAEHLRVGR